MTADDVRAVLRDLEGVEERAHMGHPDFRVHGRIFASLTADGARAHVKLRPEEQAELVQEAPKRFTPAAGAWGRSGWTSIVLAGADRALVRGALIMGWEVARVAPPRRSHPATSRARRP